MAETIRIEIPIEVDDNTGPGTSSVEKNMNKVKDAADKVKSSTDQMSTSAKKANDEVTKFDRSAQKTQKSLLSWAKEKYSVLLEAKDKISPILSTIKGGLTSFGRKTWSVTMKAVDLATAPIRGVINLLKNPILQVGAVLGVSIGLKDTIDTYKDFEAAMSQVKAVSGATGSEFDKLTAKAKEMGATTKFTATQSAEAFNYMAMAGWDSQQMLDGIEGILNLAAASGEDLGTTSDIVTDALTAFGLKASDAAHFSDVLAQSAASANTNVSMMGESFKYVAPIAGAMKYSVEDTSLALGLMANASVKGSMAGTSLKTALANMAAPTDKMATAMKKYGISLTDSNGNMKTLKGVLDNLRSSLGGLSETEKTAAASTIFGKEAMSGMLAIINATESDYNKLADSINNADGAASRMSDTMLDNLEGSITLLQSAMDGVKISFGERLSPYVRGIADWLTDQMPNIEQGLNEMMDWVDTKVDRMKRKFKEMTQSDEWQNADFFGKVKIAWDDFIAEPFSEWWNSTGKQKIADIAGDMGTSIGTGLKLGILTLLGVDVSDTLNEGASVGASFAKGFAEGFDSDAITSKLFQGFGNMVKSAGKLLPGGKSADLSSIFSAVMLARMAGPIASLGKGTFSVGKAIFGKDAATGTSLAGSIGSTIMGSAAKGTGLKGLGATMGMVGNALGSGATTGAGLIAAGTAGTVGGIAGGATLVSAGIDAYKAIKSDDKAEKSAYGESAAWKAGGVAAGAAAGAALGSVIPGLGTAVGALVGAGVGGISGWIKGNKVKKEYQDNVEEMQKEAEKAQKVFDATGLSIDKVRFANDDLNDAMNDSSVTAEQLASYIQEDVAKVGKEAFGNIKLSLSEIKDLANKITFADMGDGITKFNEATESAKESLSSLESSISTMKKENWKVGLGMQLSETDVDDYKTSIDNFVKSAQDYIENSHYEATVALELLTNGEGSTEGLDSMYNNMKSQIEELSGKLSDTVNIALEDGVITLDESKEITNLQEQITAITEKVSKAQEDASFQTLKIKYGNGASLDIDSFNQLQEELQAQVSSFKETYDNALTVTLTNLNLQLSEGAITQEQYDAAVQQATDGYYANINDMEVRVSSFNLDTIAEAWNDELAGIMPDMEGSVSEKLNAALQTALSEKPDISSWTQEDMMGWLGLDDMTIDTSAFENIYQELVATAENMAPTAKEEIVQSLKESIPTMEEVMAEYGPISNEAYESIVEQYKEAMNSSFESADFSSIGTTLSTKMSDSILNTDTSAFSTAFAELGTKSGTDAATAFQAADYSGVGAAVGSGISSAITNADMAQINSAVDALKSNTDSSVNSAFGAGVSTTMPVSVTLDYSLVNPTKTFTIGGGGSGSTTLTVSAHASGGYVNDKQLSWVGEEGPEAIIPLVPGRRNRALELYKEVGDILGVQANANGNIIGEATPLGGAKTVSAHASGGYVNDALDVPDVPHKPYEIETPMESVIKNITPYSAGQSSIGSTATEMFAYSSISDFLSLNDNLLAEAIRNGATGYNGFTEGTESDSDTADEPLSSSSTVETGKTNINLNIQMSPQFNISDSGNGKMDEASIMAIIRKNMKSMADELGGEIADRLEQVFSNMPVVKEG
jgi:TP901 family phage tail tape measure protein|nr:MAG TPA: minor tail protein [Caudoviricetes sp.]